ncbi:lipopolysaccharide biosynthesis protein [Desulfovibrio ferrophilus]|uniref:lipopolysaccharide biosynthesis protein n=1 Tax=Desulfovibrio ferrophilus TaxID=241368 RepID=UPI000F83641F|nr:oligosaccharide flippase family protein [Desulfovibrio ferrophilus]
MSFNSKVISVVIQKAIALVLGLGTSVIVARCLSPDEFGVLRFILAMVGAIVPLVLLGQPSANIYSMSKFRNRARSIATNSFLYSLFVSAVVCVTWWLFFDRIRQYYNPDVSALHYSYVMWLFPLFFFKACNLSQVRGLDDIRGFNTVNYVESFGRFLLYAVFLLGLDLGLNSAVLANFIVIGAQVVLIIGLIVRQIGLPRWSIDWNLFKDSIRFGAMCHVGDFLGNLARVSLPVFVLGHYASMESFGFYALAKSLIVMGALILRSINVVFLPKVSRVDDELSFVLTARVLRVGLFLAILNMLPIYIFSPWVVPLFYGVEYNETVSVLFILAPGVFLESLQAFVISYFLSRGMLWTRSMIAGVRLVVSALLMGGLIFAGFDFFGFCWVLTLSEVIMTLFCLGLFMHSNVSRSWRLIFAPSKDDYRELAELFKAMRQRMGIRKV